MDIRIGRQENLPYSLSRWTDLPAGKWDWFKQRLRGSKAMVAFDPRTSIPAMWSLYPEDTLGLIFWTKNPANLIRDAAWLRDYKVKIHVTLTGWREVEPDVPSISQGVHLIRQAVDVFGPDAVAWRFSPIPMLPTHDVLQRFWSIADGLRGSGLSKVYASFLHANDLMPETRTQDERAALLWNMADRAQEYGLDVISCNVDPTIVINPHNLYKGVCEDGSTFGGRRDAPEIKGVQPFICNGKGMYKETCGCVQTVDPFSVNEACCYSCRYCYAADRALSQIRRNTTNA
jgi:hypothetical protein